MRKVMLRASHQNFKRKTIADLVIFLENQEAMSPFDFVLTRAKVPSLTRK